MTKEYRDAVEYCNLVYGLEPSDLDLQEDATVEEVERLAVKYGLTRHEDMTLDKARQVLKTLRGL